MRALSAAAAVTTTRDLHDIRAELRELRNRRDSNGNEDSGVRWLREMLEQEEARARAKHADRNLTDSEAAWFEQRLQQIVADATAEIYKHIENLQQVHLDAIGDAFARQNSKNRDLLQRYIDEKLAKLRMGPQGPRGATGEKGTYGARGPQGKEGPRGKPGTTVERWEIDRRSYTFWPVMSDGSTGPQLALKGLFEQFLVDVKGSR